MRLLYISHCLPYPPNKGDRVRAFHSLRVLATQGHRVHLMALVKPGEQISNRHFLDEYCEQIEVFPIRMMPARWRGIKALIGSRPLTHSYFFSRRLWERIALLSRERSHDGVIAYSSAMAPYATLVPDVPRILDMVDVDSEKWAQYAQVASQPRRSVYGIEAKRLQRYESSIGNQFDEVIVATERERRILQKISPKASVAAVRNGVDAEFFRPSGRAKATSPTLVFTGQMDYLPNSDAVTSFARETFPRLRLEHPGIEFLVVGRSPSPEVQNLSRIAGITVTGAVEDIRPFLEQSWIFVAPLRISQGVQNKVLEAMALELPVVVSPLVHAGLADGNFTPETDLLVAKDSSEFCRAISGLIQDGQKRQEMGMIGRRRVVESYSWDRNFSHLEKLLHKPVGSDEQSQGTYLVGVGSD